MSGVEDLARPFPTRYVHDDGRGNSYVPHHIVLQRLIVIYGRPPRLELLREIYDGDVLTGVVVRLTVPGLDPVEEAGESDNPQSKTNGAKLKDAVSDGVKRAAMRLGCGLHLWSQDEYFLYDHLKSAGSSGNGATEGSGPYSSPATSSPQDQTGADKW